LIDNEIRKIIDANYDIAYRALEENKDILHAMAKALIEFETIDKGQIDDLMERKPIREAAVIVDSDVVSTDLGKGVKGKDDSSNNSDEKPLGGGTEQVA
jgi:cell division protease FtsH